MITIAARGTTVIPGGMEPLPDGYAIVVDSENKIVWDSNGKILIARYE